MSVHASGWDPARKVLETRHPQRWGSERPDPEQLGELIDTARSAIEFHRKLAETDFARMSRAQRMAVRQITESREYHEHLATLLEHVLEIVGKLR